MLYNRFTAEDRNPTLSGPLAPVTRLAGLLKRSAIGSLISSLPPLWPEAAHDRSETGSLAGRGRHASEWRLPAVKLIGTEFIASTRLFEGKVASAHRFDNGCFSARNPALTRERKGIDRVIWEGKADGHFVVTWLRGTTPNVGSRGKASVSYITFE